MCDLGSYRFFALFPIAFILQTVIIVSLVCEEFGKNYYLWTVSDCMTD